MQHQLLVITHWAQQGADVCDLSYAPRFVHVTTSCYGRNFCTVVDYVFLVEKTMPMGSRPDVTLRVSRESFGESVWVDPRAPSGTEWVGWRGKGLLGQSGRETNRSVGVQGEFRWGIISGIELCMCINDWREEEDIIAIYVSLSFFIF